MELIKQPRGSKLCGQCCIAMIAEVTPNAACYKIGHTRGTYTREIIKALRGFGFITSDRLVILKDKVLPDLCMIKIQWKGWKSHWAVHNEGIIYDPIYGMLSFDKDVYSGLEGRITSFLKIEKL